MKKLSFLILLSLFSCTKELEIKQQLVENKLVLNSIIQDGKRINAHISCSREFTDSSSYWINDVDVKLYENGVFVETLSENKNFPGWYESNCEAKTGAEYTLEVLKDGFQTVSAKVIVPDIIPVNNASIRLNSFKYYSDDSGDTSTGWEYDLTFLDAEDNVDFYEIQSVEIGENRYGNRSLSLLNHPFAYDPVFNSEDYIAFSPNQFVFNDQTFKNNNIRIEMKMENGSGGVGDTLAYSSAYEDLNEKGYYIILRHISNSYYQFVKSWIKHYMNRQFGNSFDDYIFKGIAGNPVPLYSNVENGYGIVAAFSQSYRHITVNE